jgi:pyrroline-5-carboxylate reductase
MRIGFVGTGVITRAVVTGMIRFEVPFERIALSPRSADTAAALAELDSRVEVCGSNQAVLDTSDVICLAVRPQIAADVLPTLKFEPRHHVISFIAGKSLAQVGEWVGDVAAVIRAIPLPAVSEGKGSTALCPPDAIARTLFAPLGKAVEVESEHQFDALSAATATMASYFALLEEQASWLVSQGLSYEAARAFLSGFQVGLAHETTKNDQPFAELVGEMCTPGGLNEQVTRELSQRGTYQHYVDALERIMKRVQGR